jgi:hypothetical protein
MTAKMIGGRGVGEGVALGSGVLVKAVLGSGAVAARCASSVAGVRDVASAVNAEIGTGVELAARLEPPHALNKNKAVQSMAPMAGLTVGILT